MPAGEPEHPVDQGEVGGARGERAGRLSGFGLLDRDEALALQRIIRLVLGLGAALHERLRHRSRGGCVRFREPLSVNFQRLREGGDRRQQSLLEPDKREPKEPSVASPHVRRLRPQRLAIIQELARQQQLRRVARQILDDEGLDLPLWKLRPKVTKVRLQPPHHNRIEFARLHWDAAREALRVENFEERGERIAVAVVGRRRQEQAVLKSLGEPPDRPGELAVDRIARAARRGGVMRLVEDQ